MPEHSTIEVADWLIDDLRELVDDPEFVTEEILLDLNEQICEIMENEGISRAELARRLEWKRSAVTKLLNGNHNISIKRIVTVVLALGYLLRPLKLIPKEAKKTHIRPLTTTTDISRTPGASEYFQGSFRMATDVSSTPVSPDIGTGASEGKWKPLRSAASKSDGREEIRTGENDEPELELA